MAKFIIVTLSVVLALYQSSVEGNSDDQGGSPSLFDPNLITQYMNYENLQVAAKKIPGADSIPSLDKMPVIDQVKEGAKNLDMKNLASKFPGADSISSLDKMPVVDQVKEGATNLDMKNLASKIPGGDSMSGLTKLSGVEGFTGGVQQLVGGDSFSNIQIEKKD